MVINSPLGDYQFTADLQIVTDRLNHFRMSETLTDVVIKIGDKTFPAHRSILIGASTFFERLFTTEMQELKPQVTFPPEVIDPAVFELVLKFIYTSTIHFTKQNIKSVTITADYLLIPQLILASDIYLSEILELDYVFEHFCFAKKYCLLNLQTACVRLIVDKVVLPECENYIVLSLEEFKDLLIAIRRDYKFKPHLYDAVLKWVQFLKRERAVSMLSLMKLLPTMFMPRKFIWKQIITDPIIIESPGCLALFAYYLRKKASSKLYILGSHSSSKQSFKDGKCETKTEHQVLLSVYDTVHFEVASTVLFSDAKEVDANYGMECLFYKKNLIINFLSGPQFYEFVDCNQTLYPLTDMEVRKVSSAMTLNDKHIYVIEDGHSFLKYSLSTAKWEEMGETLSARHSRKLVYLDGYIYALGGKSTTVDEGEPIRNVVERYDIRHDDWQIMTPMNVNDFDLSATVFRNKIYIADQKRFEVYDPARDEWSAMPDLEFSDAQLTVLNDRLLAVGNRAVEGDKCRMRIVLFDVDKHSWQLVQDIELPALDDFCIASYNPA